MSAVTQVIRERAKHEGNWLIRRGGRWWYAVKVLTCMALRLHKKGTYGRFNDEFIVVATLGGSSHYIPGEPTTWSWTEVRVGRGVFRSWRYSIEMEWSG